MVKKFDHNDRTRQFHYRLIAMREDFADFVRPRWYRRGPSVSDRLAYLTELSCVRSTLVGEILKLHPELQSISGFSINDAGIEATIAEPASGDAVRLSPDEPVMSTRA